jgi:aldehyde dehydrogenase (NAD+)
MSANQRRGILNKFADLIEKNADGIAQLSRISLGAPAAFGAFEIGLCAEVCMTLGQASGSTSDSESDH